MIKLVPRTKEAWCEVSRIDSRSLWSRVNVSDSELTRLRWFSDLPSKSNWIFRTRLLNDAGVVILVLGETRRWSVLSVVSVLVSVSQGVLCVGFRIVRIRRFIGGLYSSEVLYASIHFFRLRTSSTDFGRLPQNSGVHLDQYREMKEFDRWVNRGEVRGEKFALCVNLRSRTLAVYYA